MNPIQTLIDNIEKVIVGKRESIELTIIALLCRGHVLIEDVPGTGKTMLARALAKSLMAKTHRLQCTADLLPTDITGVPIFNQKKGDFEFRPGPVFTNVLLADEINRATPRAQSALLECMEEYQVSVDGTTYALPELFMVIATQNPIDMAGTYTLPEAQLDRFLMCISVGYPHHKQEASLLATHLNNHPINQLKPVVTANDILSAREKLSNIHLSPELADYVVRLAQATRSHPDIKLGVSPRATLALSKAAKAMAFMRQRDYVTPDMVKTLLTPVWAHRLLLKPQANAQGQSVTQLLKTISDQTLPPA